MRDFLSSVEVGDRGHEQWTRFFDGAFCLGTGQALAAMFLVETSW